MKTQVRKADYVMDVRIRGIIFENAEQREQGPGDARLGQVWEDMLPNLIGDDVTELKEQALVKKAYPKRLSLILDHKYFMRNIHCLYKVLQAMTKSKSESEVKARINAGDAICTNFLDKCVIGLDALNEWKQQLADKYIPKYPFLKALHVSMTSYGSYRPALRKLTVGGTITQ